MGTASTGISIISFTTTLNHFHNNLKLFDTSPIFFSPQVKRSSIVSNKHGIHELPNKLPNNLRLLL